MTFDFIEDAVEALEKSGYPYLIVVEHPSGKGARVLSDLGKWKKNNKKVTVREDIHQLLDVTVFEEEN